MCVTETKIYEVLSADMMTKVIVEHLTKAHFTHVFLYCKLLVRPLDIHTDECHFRWKTVVPLCRYLTAAPLGPVEKFGTKK